MNKQEFYESIKEFNIEITDDKIAQVDKYIDFLIQYNTHTNLTSIKDKDDIYLKHFYDSLTILKSIDLNEYKDITRCRFRSRISRDCYQNILSSP